jgi:hypothetical protein
MSPESFSSPFAGSRLAPSSEGWFDARGRRLEETGKVTVARSAARKPSCADCYFSRNLLCALPEQEPCATFRPDHPEGLRPPQQLHFVFRSERRARAVWAFPTAQEQAALHA